MKDTQVKDICKNKNSRNCVFISIGIYPCSSMLQKDLGKMHSSTEQKLNRRNIGGGRSKEGIKRK